MSSLILSPLTSTMRRRLTVLCGCLVPLWLHAQGAPAMAAGGAETRVIVLEGQSNFRDLGGYSSVDGRHLKWGQVFRSGELSQLTSDDYRRLGQLGIHTVYDLRDEGERNARPTRWETTPVRAMASPKQTTDSSAVAMLTAPDVTPARASEVMAGFYAQMPRLYAPEYRAVFGELLAAHTPLLVHCTAGKDRTGLASALILKALNVPDASIEADYALTDRLLQPSRLSATTPFMKKMMALPPGVQRAMTRADPRYIEAAFASIDRDYGSMDRYLQTELGVGPVERQRLQALLLTTDAAR